MNLALFSIRRNERRDTYAAFLVLFGFVASLSLLETARDALFLAYARPTRLPWMYIAIAAVSLIFTRLRDKYSRTAGRTQLAAAIFGSALITTGLARFLPQLAKPGTYIVYVWSSVFAVLVLVNFWTYLGSVFTVTQAKRVYGIIGVGSVVGAVAGSAIARALAHSWSPRQLIFLSGAGLFATATLPAFFKKGTTAPMGDAAQSRAPMMESLSIVMRQSYARRLAFVLSASTACVTIADYVFKTTVAANIAKADLTAWLATTSLVLNLASLLVQLVVTGWLVNRIAVPVAFAVLPSLLFVGGLGMVAMGGSMVAALVIKGADGSLRYSLHKTCSEMLFLPFTDSARRRVKAFIDVLGQRSGQVLGSLLMLVFSTSERTKAAPVTLVLLAGIVMILSLSLRGPYLELFRGRLLASRLEHLTEFPGLDLASLETVVAALDSSRDEEVLAALDVLEREGRTRLIPSLLLYHPAEAVVERTLAIFARAKRFQSLDAIERLLEHPSPALRAAAVSAHSAIDGNRSAKMIRRMKDERSPEVLAANLVNTLAGWAESGADVRGLAMPFVHRSNTKTRAVFGRAVARRGGHFFVQEIIALSRDEDVEVRYAAATAMRDIDDERFVEPLVSLLLDERTRFVARDALAARGPSVLKRLITILDEPGRQPQLRWRIAQVIPLFESQLAADTLLALLRREDDGAVRFQMIRGLESLVRRDPKLNLDHGILKDAISATVRRAYRYLARRVALEQGADAEPARRTAGHRLLVGVLNDKIKNAVDRLFRLLALRYPSEDFVQFYRGILHGGRDERASAMELIQNLLDPPLRGAVMGLVDDISDERRLEEAGPYRERIPTEYEALLAHIIESTSEAVRDVAVYHIGELGLGALRPKLESMLPDTMLSDHGATSVVLSALEKLPQVSENVS